MIVEIPDQQTKIRDDLLENGWEKQYTWVELVRWLDERARRKVANLQIANNSTSSRKFRQAARFERDLAQIDKIHARIKTPAKSREKPEQTASLLSSQYHRMREMCSLQAVLVEGKVGIPLANHQ